MVILLNDSDNMEEVPTPVVNVNLWFQTAWFAVMA